MQSQLDTGYEKPRGFQMQNTAAPGIYRQDFEKH